MTGFGRSQVYGFTKQSGGAISVGSEINKVTCVIPYLPRSKEIPETNHKEAQGLVIENSGNETILRVDDESSLLALNKKILEDNASLEFRANNALKIPKKSY